MWADRFGSDSAVGVELVQLYYPIRVHEAGTALDEERLAVGHRQAEAVVVVETHRLSPVDHVSAETATGVERVRLYYPIHVHETATALDDERLAAAHRQIESVVVVEVHRTGPVSHVSVEAATGVELFRLVAAHTDDDTATYIDSFTPAYRISDRDAAAAIENAVLGEIAVTSVELALAVDAHRVTAVLVDDDQAVGAEKDIKGLFSSDTATATDAVQSMTAAQTSSDTAAGVEVVQLGVGILSADTAVALEVGRVRVVVLDTDTGETLDITASAITRLHSQDTATGEELAATIAAVLSDELGIAVERFRRVSILLSSPAPLVAGGSATMVETGRSSYALVAATLGSSRAMSTNPTRVLEGGTRTMTESTRGATDATHS